MQNPPHAGVGQTDAIRILPQPRDAPSIRAHLERLSSVRVAVVWVRRPVKQPPYDGGMKTLEQLRNVPDQQRAYVIHGISRVGAHITLIRAHGHATTRYRLADRLTPDEQSACQRAAEYVARNVCGDHQRAIDILRAAGFDARSL